MSPAKYKIHIADSNYTEWTLYDESTMEPTVIEEEEIENETKNEVKAFMKWANKGKRARLFEFKTLDPIVGDALNRCAYEGDLDSARALAKAYLSWSGGLSKPMGEWRPRVR